MPVNVNPETLAIASVSALICAIIIRLAANSFRFRFGFEASTGPHPNQVSNDGLAQLSNNPQISHLMEELDMVHKDMEIIRAASGLPLDPLCTPCDEFALGLNRQLSCDCTFCKEEIPALREVNKKDLELVAKPNVNPSTATLKGSRHHRHNKQKNITTEKKNSNQFSQSQESQVIVAGNPTQLELDGMVGIKDSGRPVKEIKPHEANQEKSLATTSLKTIENGKDLHLNKNNGEEQEEHLTDGKTLIKPLKDGDVNGYAKITRDVGPEPSDGIETPDGEYRLEERTDRKISLGFSMDI